MKVTLIDCTGMGTPNPENYAASILIYTKNTRLQMTPSMLSEITEWPWDKKLEELRYMANTLPSSWEFIDYSFCIEGVTRAFTHQLVRTRTASYAQQAMRVLNVSEGRGWDYATGPTIKDSEHASNVYNDCMNQINISYRQLVEELGVKIEDARGLLPTNILTNINMKVDMRNFVTLARKRGSSRVQDEYRSVIDAMREAALAVHPFLSIFLERTADNARRELDAVIRALPLSDTEKTNMVKLLDLVGNAE